MLSDRAIERPRLIVLGAILLCVMGAGAAILLPKSAEPRVRVPVIIAVVANPGGQPLTNEREIVRKVEEQIGTLSNLKDRGFVLSSSVSGAAVLQFMFDDGVDIAEAKRDVESLMSRVQAEFPEAVRNGAGGWAVEDIAFEDWPIIQIFVAGGTDGVERKQVADSLKQQIENTPGIASVDVFGGLEEEVHVDVNPHIMALYGFTYEQVEAALRRGNLEAPSGSIQSSGGSDTRVVARGKFEHIDQIRELPVGASDGKPVRLADVASVTMGHRQRDSIARYGGDDAVVLLARPKTDIDVWKTATAVQAQVDEFIVAGRGGKCRIGTVRSQAREIRYMISQLGGSAIYGTITVILILCFFMGWRNAAMISVSLPIAILGTAALMWVAKRTVAPDLAINMMTLFATILVVGMVVDGCIIVGENIFRHRELGTTPVLAAKRGIHEVGGSLMGAYLTTFFAFAPMYLMRGIMGDYMELMPTVVLFALCAAMLVDHFLLPVLSVYFMKVSPRRMQVAEAQRALHLVNEDSDATQHDEAMSVEDREIKDARRAAAASKPKRVYGDMLRYAMRHRLFVLGVALAIVITPVGLFHYGAIGAEFFPDSDVPMIEVNFELPLGSSMEGRTVAVAEEIEAAVRRAVRPEEWHKPSADSPRVEPVTTMGDPGALNTRLDLPTGSGPEFGMVYVELELAENRSRTAGEIRDAIKKEIPPLPGVIVRVSSPSEGPPAGAPIMLRVQGHDDTTMEQLAARAAEVEAVLASMPGVYDVTSDHRTRPQLSVNPNRTIARMFGVDTAQITAAQHYALDGKEVGEVDFGRGEDIKIRLRNERTQRDQLADLEDLPLLGLGAKVVTIGQVADVERTSSANVVRHYDQNRVINVRAQLREGVMADDVKAALLSALRPELTEAQHRAIVSNRDDRTLLNDEQIAVAFGGEIEVRDEAMEDLMVALAVGAALIMITLVVKFNSFIQPLIVLFSVPLSLVGVSIGLMLCGLHFSISAMIGVVALAGIVVNDAIVLVDFINRMRRAGVPMADAVVYAGQLRFRPILLTTVTTIGGLLPLALNVAGGGEFWQPLTVTIIFGLGFATLLQLFVIPLLCYTFDFGASLLDPMRRTDLAGDDATPLAA